MSSNVILQPAAEADLQEAYEWYEQRETELGAEFMRCVDSCVQLIRRHPEMYPVIHKHVRQGVVRRFPYSVMYFMANDSVIVTAIFHAARDPRIWKRRA
jgi:plasmid stabilization system protein ParE